MGSLQYTRTRSEKLTNLSNTVRSSSKTGCHQAARSVMRAPGQWDSEFTFVHPWTWPSRLALVLVDICDLII